MKVFMSAIGCCIFLFLYSNISAQPFYQEDFSVSPFQNDWQTSDDSGNGQLWQYCDQIFNCPPFTQLNGHEASDIPIGTFDAYSARNGYLYIDGTANEFNSQITSPTLDCSDATTVVLSFSSLLIYQNNAPDASAIVQVKSGDGPFQDYNIFPTWDVLSPEGEPIPTWNGNQILVDISDQAALSSEVTIRWRWIAGNDFLWAIDDVVLYNYHPYYDKVLWGVEEGDFSDGFTGWNSEFSGGGCEWEYTSNGVVDNQSPLQNDYTSICSITPQNGAALINATSCFENTNSSQTNAQLISPIIDLTDADPDAKLQLSFFQQVQVGNTATNNTPVTQVSWRKENDLWSFPVDVNPLTPFQEINCGKVVIPLPDELKGENDVQIRFSFQGLLFYWIIDDVQIVENADRDLLLKENFYSIPYNYATPASQVDTIRGLIDIENSGQEDIINATVVHQIFNSETDELLYENNLLFDTIKAGEIIENQLFNGGFLPPEEAMSYYGRYEIIDTYNDRYINNNRIEFNFEINDSLFAKERGAITGFVPPNTNIYEIGNCFYVPNGEGMIADKVTFSYVSYPSFENAALQVAIYKWNLASPQDSIAETNELQFLGGNNFLNTANGTGLTTVTVDLQALDGNTEITLENNSYYLLTVGYNGFNGCQGQICPFFIGASDEFNYTANYFMTRNLLSNPRFQSVFRINNNEDFNTIGFSLRRTPVVRLHLDMTNNVDEPIVSSDEVWRIFPNPVDDILTVFFDEKIDQNSSGIFEIFNISGSEIMSKKADFKEVFRWNISQLPAGFYLLKWNEKSGNPATQRFIKK